MKVFSTEGRELQSYKCGAWIYSFKKWTAINKMRYQSSQEIHIEQRLGMQQKV